MEGGPFASPTPGYVRGFMSARHFGLAGPFLAHAGRAPSLSSPKVTEDQELSKTDGVNQEETDPILPSLRIELEFSFLERGHFYIRS